MIFVWQLLASLAGQLNALHPLRVLCVSCGDTFNFNRRDAENAEEAQRVESGLLPIALVPLTMDPQFTPGDDLIFQLESGYGLLRVLALDGEGSATVWHLLAYEDFFPSVEAAEQALAGSTPLSVRKSHMAITNRAFERTPAAKLGNRPVTEDEITFYHDWLNSDRQVSDRSALLMLGIR